MFVFGTMQPIYAFFLYLGLGGGGVVPEFELYLANLTLVPTLSSMVWVIHLVTLLPLSFLPRNEGDMVHLRIFHCYSD